ncbi:MAG: hypothetical protein ACFE88_00815 [Candidatus Hermodarchaeota archaeon]
MEEKREEDLEKEFDENGPDPTKDAFFADMMDMEEEIATEAYELVEHAMNLIASQYFDDGIEILRQAIGLYAQINREEEIEAINDKISELYILKEKSFREIEAQPERKVEDLKDIDEEIEEGAVIEEEELIEETKTEADLISLADHLIVEAHELTNNNNFEEAFDKYDEAEKILEELNKNEEIERLFILIEECYNKKAEYLRSLKKEEVDFEIEIEAPISEELEKEKKLEQFLEAKKREEEISTRAYEILEQAVEKAKLYEYDQAIELYSEGVNLFEELNWNYEAKRIRDTIEQLEKEKFRHLKELEKEKVEVEQKVEIEIKQEKLIEQYAKEISEQEKLAQLERLRGLELQRMEQDFFKVQIDNMASEAARMAREYELAMQKAIKDGEMVEKCIYPKVIEIYKKIKDLLIDKDWNKEAAIYDDTIEIYIQKFEKDKKIRKIEVDKIRKQEEAKEVLKIKQEGIVTRISEEEKQDIEKQRQKAIEIQNIRNQFEEMTNRAERLAREYEVALRQGKFELKCPYKEIIQIFERAREMALERGWETDVTIFSSQMYTYKQKLEKDNRLRQIEAEKARKQEEIEETLKIKKEKPLMGLETERLRILEKQKKIEEEKLEFDNIIDVMVNRAEKMAREYNSEMKKAIKKGKLAENPPFLKIIGIYERVKRMLLEKGREGEAAAYSTQINFYTQKLEHDNKLREVEAKKAQREKALEEMHKVGKQIGLDEEKLKLIEKKKEMEDLKKYINENINRAEKMVHDYEMAMRKAYRRGEIIEITPYSEVIEIYKELREKIYAQGWKEQAEVYANQIKIYQEKLEKHQKLLEVEAQKVQREKEIEEMHKIEKEVEVDHKKLEIREKEKEEKEFQKFITEEVNKAEKLEREFDSAMKKAIKKGEVIEQTPYPEIIEIYKEIRKKVYAWGWKDQANVYANQIKIYQEKLEKHQKLLEVEAQKAQRDKDIEEMHKVEREIEVDDKKLAAIDRKKEEKEFQKSITEEVNKAEKLEREFDSAMKKAIKKGEIIEQTPYPEIIEIYKGIKEKVYSRGWNEQAEVYANQIKIYQEKLEKHQKLLEVEAQKAQRDKDIEEMHKVDKEVEIDHKKLEISEREKEEKEFQKSITEEVNKAEKLEREFDSAMKKAIKKGEIIEQTPYLEIIEIYKEIRKKVYTWGWKDQAEVYANQIKIYQEKLEKHQKLLEVEVQKVQREKEIEEMHKIEKEVEIDHKKLEISEKEKEEKEFQKSITEEVNKAEKLEREFDSAMKKAIKKGEIIEQTPYLEIIEIYKEIRKKVYAWGWKDQAEVYANQIKIYQEKLEKHQKLLEFEVQKVQREKELEELHKLSKREIKPVKPEKIDELEKEKEEDILLDKAMNLIDEAEKEVKHYELSIRKDILIYDSPYEKALSNYKQAIEIFQEIGWNEEANRLINTIKFYMDKKEKDDNLRIIEKKKLEESEIELLAADLDIDKDFLERQKRILEIQQKKKESDEIAEGIFDMIQEAERMAQEYEIKIKGGVFDFEAPYEKIIEIYREARKQFEKIDWKEESAKLIETIKFYKEKLERDNKIRALEAEKAKKREEELMLQQKLLEQARIEQEKLLKQRKETLHLKKERIAQFETQKDKAFRLMDQAKRELRQNHFDKAIEIYKQSEQIFFDIEWQEGIRMIRDSITMIVNKKTAYELEQQVIEKRKAEELLIEEKLEEKVAEAQIIRNRQQEEKRRELLKIQSEKERERQISEEAYELLEEGTALMDGAKFSEAYDKYISARELFEKISWHREVSRINNDLLFKLKQEQKQAEIYEEIKLKKIEEEKEMELLKEETKRQHEELEKRKKEEKRKLAKEELDRKISIKLEKADHLIDRFRLNEGILILREEVQRLTKLEKSDEIERITEQISKIKTKTQIPLITIDASLDVLHNKNFESAYKALDKAHVSLVDENFKKAISELNEAKFQLKEVKIEKKIIKEIDNKIIELKTKVTKKPIRELIKGKEEPSADEMEKLSKRIKARREERRKKVLDLLGKSKE